MRPTGNNFQIVTCYLLPETALSALHTLSFRQLRSIVCNKTTYRAASQDPSLAVFSLQK